MARHEQQHLLDSVTDHDCSGFTLDEILEVADPGGGARARSTGIATLDVSDAVAKRHTQDTDQYLDFGGANQVAASALKALVDGLTLAPATLEQFLRFNGTKFVPYSLEAADVPVTSVGNLASTDVQAALQELQGDIDTLKTKLDQLGYSVRTGIGPIVTTDQVVNINAAGSHALPDPTTMSGRGFWVKRINGGTGVGNYVTLTTPSGLIDGAATYVLQSQYDSVFVVSDGTNWWVF